MRHSGYHMKEVNFLSESNHFHRMIKVAISLVTSLQVKMRMKIFWKKERMKRMKKS